MPEKESFILRALYFFPDLFDSFKDYKLNKTPLMRIVVGFSIALFLVILATGGTAFIFSMKQIISANKGSELSQMLEIERLRLEISVNGEIPVVLKMADSPLIKRHFIDPSNIEAARLAQEEIETYRRALSSKSVFWVNDIDKVFYSDYADTTYILDPSLPDNYWYNMTLYDNKVFNFNINYNPNLNVTNLWINAPVFDDRRRPLGIVGTSFDLSTFINSVYRNYTGKADIYFLNAAGEITGAKDIELVANKVKINHVFINSGINIILSAANLKPGETKLFDSPLGKIAIGTIPLFDWYSVAVLPDSISDYNSTMTALFLVMLIVLAFVFVIFNLFIAQLIKPLRKSINDAETANLAKSAFLANMSHEIRTPMNSIVGFSELAMDGETSPKTRDYLSKIQTNAEWLLQIVNDILDLSKIESGKMELEKIPFDMHELFASCRALFMPKATEKGIQLHFYAEPSFGKIPLGDPTRLRQALVNLLSNAVKFTKTGMIKINAVIINKTDTDITMHFEVKDSGIGMTEKQLKKIFEPFIQAESGTTRKYGGTGLGLPITKSIIEMMGGELSIESTIGVGSKFSFDLTFETVEADQEQIFAKKIVFDEIEKPIFKGEVLLCEDNDMNQNVICEHLARVGLKTVVADNGKIGVDMVRGRLRSGEKQFDLILMDMHMPVMDGLEASTKILEFKTGIPIIALTANVMSNDREIYRQRGINDCVGKPFTSQELWWCLLKYLKPISVGISHKEDVKKDSFESDLIFQIGLKKLFARSNQNKFEEIVKALETGDIKLAHRLSHTLKTNAAQIGKIHLQQAASDVERQLKDGHNFAAPQQLALLKTELNGVLAELAPLLEEQDEPVQPGEPLGAEETSKLFDELEPMLRTGNADCRTFTADLRRIPHTEMLIQQIEDFDFDAAFVTLVELKKSF